MPSSKKLMSIFTDKAKAETFDKEEILRNISLTGNVSEEYSGIKHVISIHGENLNHILNLTSGLARIQSHVVKEFSLIIEQPKTLSPLNAFEIRCCLCRKVISYPAWYYNVKYTVNHFHYFICASKLSMKEEKPTTECYRHVDNR